MQRIYMVIIAMGQAMNNKLKSYWKLCAQWVLIPAQSKNTCTNWSRSLVYLITGRVQTLWSVKHYCMWFVSPLLFLIDFSWSSVRLHSTVSTHVRHLWAAFVSGLAIRLLDHDTPVQTHQQTNTYAHKEGKTRKFTLFFQHSLQNANVIMT